MLNEKDSAQLTAEEKNICSRTGITDAEFRAVRSKQTASGYRPSKDLFQNYRAKPATNAAEISVRDEKGFDALKPSQERAWTPDDDVVDDDDQFSSPTLDGLYESIGCAMNADNSKRRDYHLRAARASLNRHFEQGGDEIGSARGASIKLPYGGRSIAILSFRR